MPLVTEKVEKVCPQYIHKYLNDWHGCPAVFRNIFLIIGLILYIPVLLIGFVLGVVAS